MVANATWTVMDVWNSDAVEPTQRTLAVVTSIGMLDNEGVVLRFIPEGEGRVKVRIEDVPTRSHSDSVLAWDILERTYRKPFSSQFIPNLNRIQTFDLTDFPERLISLMVECGMRSAEESGTTIFIDGYSVDEVFVVDLGGLRFELE